MSVTQRYLFPVSPCIGVRTISWIGYAVSPNLLCLASIVSPCVSYAASGSFCSLSP